MDYSKEDLSKHLGFIQQTINRMAGNSFILKRWSVMLIVGLAALSIGKGNMTYLALSLLPTLAFWGLDAYYLRQERLFRALYDLVRKTKRKDADPFSIDTRVVSHKVESWICTLFSPTVVSLHGSALLFIILFIVAIGGLL